MEQTDKGQRSWGTLLQMVKMSSKHRMYSYYLFIGEEVCHCVSLYFIII